MHVHNERSRVELLGRWICQLVYELRTVFVDLTSQIGVELQVLLAFAEDQWLARIEA